MLLALALVISFLLPLVFPVPGSVGDIRGGADVNSSEQMRHVLSDPLGYIEVFVRYVVTAFLPLANIEDAFTSMSYLGTMNALHPWMVGVVTLGVAVIGLLDSDEQSKKLVSRKNIVWSLVVTVCSLALVCTSLYITFTAVGSPTIAGVQPRYAIPLFPFVLIFIANFKVSGLSGKRSFSCTALSLSALLLYMCLWMMLVSRIVL